MSSKMSSKMSILLPLALSFLNGALSMIITVPPVDTIGCYGGVSTFYCESDRNDIANIKWTPEANASRGITTDTNITNGTSTLHIIGLPVNEGIIICAFVTDTFDIDQQGATFTVTEIPPVNNVTIVFNDTLTSITWSPSSCIPVNHSYIVTITNDSTTVTNTTTELYYTIPVSPCSSNYTVSITVIDVEFTQYQSIPTTENGEKNNTQEITVAVQGRLVVSFDGTEDAFITVYYQINPQSHQICSSTIVQAIANIRSIIPSGYYTNKIVIDNLIKQFDNSTGMGNYTIGPIKERFIGCVNLTAPAVNDIVNVSTYNVQNFTIQLLQNGTTNITCYFAHNSSADGCQVKLISMESKNEMFFTITKTSLAQDVITEYINIAPGEYGVSVHDIVNNVVNSNSSLQEHLTYSVPDPVISSTVTTVVKATMETSVSSGLSTFMTDTTTSNPVGKKQSDTGVTVGAISIAIGGILVLCVVIIIMIALYVRYKRIRSKRIVILHSEIAYNKKNTAESNSYGAIYSVKKATVEIELSNISVLVVPDNGHRTSLIEPDDNNEDFQYRDAFLQQSDTHHNTEAMTPFTVVSSDYSTVESSSSGAPLLPPRPSTQTTVVQHQVIQQVLKEETNQILPEGTQNNEEMNQSTVSSCDSMASGQKNAILPIPLPDDKSLIRNSDGHIIPSGPKLDQSQYAVVELKPKEERPIKRVNDSTHVYATISNKDPSKPPVSPKQRTLITNETSPNNCGNDNNEQK